MARECGAAPGPPYPSRITGCWPRFDRLGGITRGGRSDDSRHQGRKFVFVNIPTLDDLDTFGVGWKISGAAAQTFRLCCIRHSGMFPCFLGGNSARFVRSMRSARVICNRVSEGSITAST